MNKKRKEEIATLVKQGKKPQEAYESTKKNKTQPKAKAAKKTTKKAKAE